MRVIVIGGHGRTGIEIVQQLVARGDKVLATIRNPKHMATRVKAGAETWMLDLDKSTGPEFAAVMVGADAVVFAAGSGENESSEIDRTGTLKTVRAAKKAVHLALSLSLEAGLAAEWQAYESILHTEDRLEALAAFREKRKPIFRGR